MIRLTIGLLLITSGCGMGRPNVIYVARHGQTEWNRVSRFQGNPCLDAVGYMNRFGLWWLLRDRPIATIYTSDLKRTKQTADLVARQHKLKPQVRKELNEVSTGVLEGLCFADLRDKAKPAAQRCRVDAKGSNPLVVVPHARKIMREAWRDRVNGRIPLGESLVELAARTAPFVEELSRSATDSEVLIVGHGVVNRTLLHHLMGWPLAAVSRLRQENDQIYRIEGANTAAPRLFLYAPGRGWKQCMSAPRPGTRRLDCHPARSSAGAPPPPPAEVPSTPPGEVPTSEVPTSEVPPSEVPPSEVPSSPPAEAPAPADPTSPPATTR